MRSALLLVVTVLLALALHFGNASWGGHFVADPTPGGDVYHLSVLYERYARHLGNGFYPAWLPEFGGGYPAPAAWMYGLNYPFMALFQVLPAEQAWTWTGIAHAAWGALGMFFLLRAQGSQAPGALVAGVLFGFSEFMIGRLTSGHLNLVMPVAWAPWVCWQALRLARSRPGAIGGLAVTAALGLLAGHVQVWIYLAPAVMALVAVESRRGVPMGTLRRSLRAGVLIVGLAAIQWIPTAELLLVSSAGEVSNSLLGVGSFDTLGAAGRILPGSLGFAADSALWGERWIGPAMEHEYVAVGGAWLPLLAVLAFRRMDGLRVFWAGLTVVGIVLAMGPHFAPSAWLHDIPPLSLARAPARALVLVTLALPVLAGLGVDSWLSDDTVAEGDQDEDEKPKKPRDPRRSRWLFLAAGVLVSISLLALALVWLNTAVHDIGPKAEAARGDALWPATWTALAGTAMVTASLVVSLIHKRLGWITVVVIALTTWFFAVPPVATVPADFYYADYSRLITRDIREHRVHLRDNRFPFVERDGVRTVRELSHVDITPFRAVWGQDPTPGAAFWMDVALWTEQGWEGPVHDSPAGLNGRALIKAGGLLPIGAGRLFEPQSELQRLTESTVVERVRSGDERLHIDLPARGGVIVLDPLPDGSVRRIQDPNPLVAEFQVDAPVDAWLFVSEKHFPGWIAEIEDRKVPLRRANAAFRALQVSAGLHTVTMRYKPATLRAGAWISFVTLIVVSAHLWWALRRSDDL